MSNATTSTAAAAAPAVDNAPVHEHGQERVCYIKPEPLYLDTVVDMPRWTRYKQHIHHILEVTEFNTLPEVAKMDIFMKWVEPRTNEQCLRDIKREEANSYDELVQRFEGYFLKKNELRSSFHFLRRNQQDGELFSVYYTELMNLIKYCNYGEHESTVLRERVVAGVRDSKMQQTLRKLKTLTFEEVKEICRASEHSQEQEQVINSTSMLLSQ